MNKLFHFLLLLGFLSFHHICKAQEIDSEPINLSWERVPVEVKGIKIFGISDSTIYGYSPTQIYRSHNYGAHWENINSIGMDVTQSEIQEATLSNNKITFLINSRTENGGGSINKIYIKEMGLHGENGRTLIDLQWSGGHFSCLTDANNVRRLTNSVVSYNEHHYCLGNFNNLFMFTDNNGTSWHSLQLNESQGNYDFDYYFPPKAYFNGKIITLNYDNQLVSLYGYARDTLLADISKYATTDSTLYAIKNYPTPTLYSTTDLMNWNSQTIPFEYVSRFYTKENQLFFHTPSGIYKSLHPDNNDFIKVFEHSTCTKLLVSGDNYLLPLQDNRFLLTNNAGTSWDTITAGYPFDGTISYPFVSSDDVFGYTKEYFQDLSKLSQDGIFLIDSIDTPNVLHKYSPYFKDGGLWLQSVTSANHDSISIKKSDDYGNTWSTVFSTNNHVTSHFHFFAHAGKIYAFSQQHNTLITTDSGITWSEIPLIFKTDELLVNDDTILAIDNQQLKLSLNSGSTWSIIKNGVNNFYTSGTTIFTNNGNKQIISKSTDMGNTWTTLLDFSGSSMYYTLLTKNNNAMILKGSFYYHNFISFDFGNTIYQFSGPFWEKLIDPYGNQQTYSVPSAYFQFIGDYLYAFANNGTWKTKITPDSSAVICEGDDYEFNGELYSETGFYAAHFTDQNGCDSSSVLFLTVQQPTITEINIDITSGETYNDIPIFNDTTIIENYSSTGGCDSIVEIHLTVITGIDALPKNLLDLTIYPNPVSNNIHINYNLANPEEIRIIIFDVLGKTTYTNTYEKYSDGQININTSQWNTGVYLIRVETNGGPVVRKVIKTE